MSALDELKKISFLDMTMLEFVITQAEHSEVTGNAEHAAQELADKDVELLALRERVARLENQLKNAQKVAVYFSKLGYGVRPSLGAMRLVRAYEAALKSQ